jgi:RNA-directed DNA polymerase
MMHGSRKSDDSVVPEKRPNEALGRPETEEAVEERGSTKGNSREQNVPRTRSRNSMPSALERVRRAARRDKKQRFTALLHHIYDPNILREAYYALKRSAAPGVDGKTWKEYGRDLGRNLQDLADRVRRGAYRAKPVLRVYVPKADGRERPLGIPTLEDKLLQRATAWVLNAIYEVDFLGFSYGFRPGRSPHDALDALTVGITSCNVNWVLDADIRGFFDALDHTWLVKMIEHRIGDSRVIRLIQKWLRAGVLEDGIRKPGEYGTVQGGSISPLLANVYLHYVLDLWAQQWREKRASGDVVIVRFADDFIVGFEHREEAEAFHRDLIERFARFSLELHPEKTKLLRFGKRARKGSKDDGPTGTPGTFRFLGFTHICGKRRDGGFTVYRHTDRKRFQAKLRDVSEKLRRMMHRPIPEQARYLAAVVRGHTRYYGVPFNSGAITRFRFAVVHIWHWFLRRRSQRNRMTWERMSRLASRWIPCRPCLPTLSVQTAPRPIPEVGAQCGSPARWDLCGGPWATRVPTATRSRAGSERRHRRPIDVANPRRISRFACGSRAPMGRRIRSFDPHKTSSTACEDRRHGSSSPARLAVESPDFDQSKIIVAPFDVVQPKLFACMSMIQKWA